MSRFKLKRYKVFVLAPKAKGERVRTYTFAKGISKKDAERNALKGFNKGAIVYDSEPAGNWVNWQLDLCYEVYPDIYMGCWEPDITTEDIIACLKTYPETASILEGGI